METVTIYIEPKQRKELRKRARQEDSNFSQQVRNAIDQYLANPGSSYSEEDLAALLKQSDMSVKNIIRMLDETSVNVKSTLSRVRKKLETI
jgi:DNA-binding GntR family transcriptional regulator